MYSNVLATFKRKILGYTQDEVVDLLGCTRSGLYFYEKDNGKQKRKSYIETNYNVLMDEHLRTVDFSRREEAISQLEEILKLLKEPR